MCRLLASEPSQAAGPPVGIRAKPSSWAACWHQTQAKQLGRLLGKEPSQVDGLPPGKRAKPSIWAACWQQSQAAWLPVGNKAKPSSWAACWQQSQAKQLGRLLATEPSQAAAPPVGNGAKPSSWEERDKAVECDLFAEMTEQVDRINSRLSRM